MSTDEFKQKLRGARSCAQIETLLCIEWPRVFGPADELVECQQLAEGRLIHLGSDADGALGGRPADFDREELAA